MPLNNWVVGNIVLSLTMNILAFILQSVEVPVRVKVVVHQFVASVLWVRH